VSDIIHFHFLFFNNNHCIPIKIKSDGATYSIDKISAIQAGGSLIHSGKAMSIIRKQFSLL
jgi:hypothetical protein